MVTCGKQALVACAQPAPLVLSNIAIVHVTSTSSHQHRHIAIVHRPSTVTLTSSTVTSRLSTITSTLSHRHRCIARPPGPLYNRPRIYVSSCCFLFYIRSFYIEPMIQTALNRSLPTATHQSKALETNKSLRGIGSFLDIFYQEALPICYLLSFVDSLLTIRDINTRES